MAVPPALDLKTLLQRSLQGQTLGRTEQEWLVSRWQDEPGRRAAFIAGLERLPDVVQRQWGELRSLYPKLDTFCRDTLGWTASLELLWDLWLPLATWLKRHWQALQRPLIQGILGGQGTGKSTLAAILSEILQHWGIRVCRLSLDDLYLTYAERQQLQEQDPRLRWRGPPGTHDLALGLAVLQQLRQPHPSSPIALPRFDKSLHNGVGDRTAPDWVMGTDIVLFEGWFVGVRPISPAEFDQAPPPILTEGDRQFARDCNIRLQSYLPLWNELDSLIVLQPTDYRLSQQWRREAEQRMVASGRSGMSDIEINHFVEYFWKALHPQLFFPPLLRSGRVDLVIEVKADHSLGEVRGGGRARMRDEG